MLPDQINNLHNIQFFVTVVMWLSLLVAMLRRRDSTSSRLLVVGFWLFVTVLICPLTTTRVDTYFATLAYSGIQNALDDQCGQGHAQAQNGRYFQMSSYHWRWDGQRGSYAVICDYERGYTSWNCVC